MRAQRNFPIFRQLIWKEPSSVKLHVHINLLSDGLTSIRKIIWVEGNSKRTIQRAVVLPLLFSDSSRVVHMVTQSPVRQHGVFGDWPSLFRNFELSADIIITMIKILSLKLHVWWWCPDMRQVTRVHCDFGFGDWSLFMFSKVGIAQCFAEQKD